MTKRYKGWPFSKLTIVKMTNGFISVHNHIRTIIIIKSIPLYFFYAPSKRFAMHLEYFTCWLMKLSTFSYRLWDRTGFSFSVVTEMFQFTTCHLYCGFPRWELRTFQTQNVSGTTFRIVTRSYLLWSQGIPKPLLCFTCSQRWTWTIDRRIMNPVL